MLIWEDLTPAQKRAIKEMSEISFEKMIRIWFQLLQGQKFLSNWHFSYLCWKVEQIINGEAQNVIFNITPGSGKTEIFSIHMPIYAMLRSRKVRNLNLSFSDGLVQQNSMRVREIVGSPEFQELWPCKLAKASSKDLTALNGDGKVWLQLNSRSIGGQVTGLRGGYMDDGFTGMLSLDDPDKPDEMLSKVRREAIHMRLKNTVRSRRMKDTTPIAMVQQRLHVNDSTWFMLNGGMGGIQFEVVSIPALVTEDYRDSLPDWLKPEFDRDVLSSEPVYIDGVAHYSFWPAKESAKDLLALREADLYTFESQYQQKPIALGGNVFKTEWFQYYGDSEKCTLPKPDRFEYTFITADTAQKVGELNDYSVFCYWGMFKDRVYFIDGIRGKWEAPDLKTNFIAFVNQCWKRNKECGTLRKIHIEDKASGTGLIQDAKRDIPIDINPVQRSTDKVTRAMDASPVMRAGRVALPHSHPMLAELLAEVAAFTYDDSHPNDDIVDNIIDAVNIEMNLADDAVGRMKRLAGMRKK
nr:MAG: terminase large subunit [Caudoviricetes sp.]UYL16449.1 MAG: terminase large subunit [Caudoviricetes sp.]UYL16501.1 MAG: terminase large subunit [Caudoviricetes sp.]UYL16541.1 MAG: terminase large subunit [Caudoviricetes sp.]UYL16584.1 MAG: terminase large subunit [Caudoviricetes sp.]